jgi:hypothetical protein
MIGMTLPNTASAAVPPNATIRVRSLVQAPLASQLVLEVLHSVGDIGLRAHDAGGLEGAVQELARRTDKWPPFSVLHVSWLLAHQHQ